MAKERDKRDKTVRRVVLAATAATLALAAALAKGWEPGIRGEWVWEQGRLLVYFAPAMAAALLLAAAAWFLCRPGRWIGMRPASRAIWLAALVLLVLALQWGLLTAVGPPSISWAAPGWIIASPNATTYFSASLDVHNVEEWVASYPQHMGGLPHHARTHPPGFALLFYGLRQASAAVISEPAPLLASLAENYNDTFGLGLRPTDAAAAVGGAAVIALIGALSLLPLYCLGRELVGPEAAIRGVVLMASMPALLLLAASSDQIILTLAVLTAWLFYSAWRRRALLRAFLAGAVAALGLFFSLGFAVAIPCAALWGVFGALRCEDRRAAVRRLLMGGAVAAAGFAAFYLTLYLLWGYRPIAVAQQALLAHREVTTAEFPRTYWKWVLMNPLEVAIFMGLPLVTATLWALRCLPREPGLARLAPFLLAWLIVLALLNISGAVRGEVSRIWLFLFWPAALASGAWLAARPRFAAVTPALVVLQVSQAFLMRGYLTIYSIL